MSDCFETDFYLCAKRGRQWNKPLHVRVTAKQPDLEAGEVAMLVKLALPKTLFQRPMLKASIAVSPNCVSPAVIDAGVADNIAEIVKQQTGVDLHITIACPEPAP